MSQDNGGVYAQFDGKSLIERVSIEVGGVEFAEWRAIRYRFSDSKIKRNLGVYQRYGVFEYADELSNGLRFAVHRKFGLSGPERDIKINRESMEIEYE